MFKSRYMFPRYVVQKFSDAAPQQKDKQSEEIMQQQREVEPVRGYEPIIGSKASREEVARYFNRAGRGLNVRLDIPVLTSDDLKWVATVMSDLARELSEVAYDADKPDILRVMEGRYLLYGAQSKINDKNQAKQVRELNAKLRNGEKITTPTKKKKLSKIKGGGEFTKDPIH